MKKRIYLHFLLIAAIAILTTLTFSMVVSYEMIRDQVYEEIQAYAYLLKDVFTEASPDWDKLTNIKTEDELRITVIQNDGNVIFDNYADTSQMDNHLGREEIQLALINGEGFTVRNSDTLSQNLFYYAIQLENGSIVRVSKQASNAWGIFLRMIPTMLVSVTVLFIICVVLAQFITGHLIAPIEKMANHMDDMESVEVYQELQPFVETIQKQHQDILKSANMRQEFTANVSHELKTPLTSISGYAELMENNLVDEENISKFAKAIHQNADRLLTLINDIIRLSELDAIQQEPEFEDTDLFELAKNCVEMLQLNANNHDVKINIDGDTQIIRGNKQMIDELIYNLCDNAIRYNKPGGVVDVLVYRSRKGIVLSVKDSGIGIPKEHQERIFERFYRVDKSRSKATGGTGLGLAIVKHIAQIHNASLEVASEIDKGTQIQVIFHTIQNVQ